MKRLAALLLVFGSACTVVNTARIDAERRPRGLFISAGDIPEPHESLGMIQVTRSGVRLFGFWDVVGTDIQAGLEQTLRPEIERLGGDGAINVRFHQIQYTPAAQVIGLIFFFVPLPSSVTVTGEVVKLR